MLRNNINRSGSLLNTFGSATSPIGVNTKLAHNWAIQNALCFGENTSYPQGCDNLDCIKPRVEDLTESGYIVAVFRGEGDMQGDLEGTGEPSILLSGSSTLYLEVDETHERTILFPGESSMSGDLEGIGNMEVDIDSGARPSAFDISQEVWQANKAAFTNPESMGYALANMDPAALADLIMNDPRFLTVAVYLGLK